MADDRDPLVPPESSQPADPSIDPASPLLITVELFTRQFELIRDDIRKTRVELKEDFRKADDRITAEQNRQGRKIAKLEVKAGVWGGLAGLIAAITAALTSLVGGGDPAGNSAANKGASSQVADVAKSEPIQAGRALELPPVPPRKPKKPKRSPEAHPAMPPKKLEQLEDQSVD